MTSYSLVTEVLATAGKLHKDDVGSQLQKLNQQIQQVKAEVCETLQKHYGDFIPILDSTLDLAARVDTVTCDMKSLAAKIENEILPEIQASSVEFRGLLTEYEESKAMLVVLEQLVTIYEKLQSVDEMVKNNDFLSASKTVEEVNVLINKLASQKRMDEIKVLKALRTEYILKKEQLIYDTSELWGKIIQWRSWKENDTSYCELKINKSAMQACAFPILVQCMQHLGRLDGPMKTFATHLMGQMFRKIIDYECTVKVKQTSDGNSVTVLPSSKTAMKPKRVFQDILAIFEFLHENLVQTTIIAQDSSSPTLMDKLSSFIREEFCESVIKDCLARAIPTRADHLQQFDEVISDTMWLQASLLELQFLTESDRALLEYAENINVLFANKKCQDILDRARDLMKRELHDTVKISNETLNSNEPANRDPSSDGDEEEVKERKSTVSLPSGDPQLNQSLFKLPTCRISVSIKELMELACCTLDEAANSSPQCAIQLFYAMRNIFELFGSVVPIYHKETLKSFPYAAAVHHNNCMFIAHRLMLLGREYRSQLPSPLSRGSATFIDLAPIYREMGTECFLSQIALQQIQITDSLAQAKGFKSVSEDSAPVSSAERAVKQCLHQVEHLNRVWRDVLPQNITYKAIGTLLKNMVNEIMTQVMALEDISADDASELCRILGMVVTRASDCLEPSSELSENEQLPIVHHCVENWMKFQELIFVLNANMYNIKERWAESKGPLAAVFTAVEVKSLIRALFQNTDKRAAVLAKII